MLETKKKFIFKKLLLVTAMMTGVFGLTGCTVKDVVVDKSQKYQTNVSYYDCNKNKKVDNWLGGINGDIKENGSMCISGIFLVKASEFEKITINDLKIIMDSPVVYTNGTVDPSDPRVVTFISPSNDVYAFTQEGLNAYNATGNETIQFNYELKKGLLDTNKPFRVYSYFGIKKILVNGKEVENNENQTNLYNGDGTLNNDIEFTWCYQIGKNTVKVVDFLDREKEVSVYFRTKEPIYEKGCPKYSFGGFAGSKYILVESAKSDIKYIKINGKKINFKKKEIERKNYSYYYLGKKKGLRIWKNTKKAVNIQIKFKNGYLFKYKI